MTHRRPVVALLLLSCVTGARPAAAQARAPDDCSVRGENNFVRDTLHDIYLWYEELPALPPAHYPSPEAYLEAVRYRVLDGSFSYISDKRSDSSFFSDSQFVGFGFASRMTSATGLRVIQVFPESPASDAGLSRGDRILEIDGRSLEELVATGDLGGAFGPDEIGIAVDIRFVDLDGRQLRARMAKRLVTIPTVSVVRTLSAGDRKVGYVFFRNFVGPSVPALDDAFARLRSEGVRDLVLDLRYNGGGLVSVAQRLASLIGGTRTEGRTFTEFFHNDKNTFRNQTLLFENPASALDLRQLVVITTGDSASASELVINSLRPFLNVVVVGARTYGKPVGQYGYDFCDRVLHPVAFDLRNALGQGDFFHGIPADCAAADDIDRALGDPEEASLAEALYYVRTGTCHVRGAARGLDRDESAPRVSGWQQLLGAH